MPCMKKDAIHQTGGLGRKPAASFNPEPRWPEGFFEVLAEAGVPERQHSFYAHWVRQFFTRNPGRSRRSLGASDIARFLQEVRSDPAMEAWQLGQARIALILYSEQFRGISLGDLSVLDAPAESVPEPSSSIGKQEVLEVRPPVAPVPPPREVKQVGSIPAPRKKGVRKKVSV